MNFRDLNGTRHHIHRPCPERWQMEGLGQLRFTRGRAGGDECGERVESRCWKGMAGIGGEEAGSGYLTRVYEKSTAPVLGVPVVSPVCQL